MCVLFYHREISSLTFTRKLHVFFSTVDVDLKEIVLDADRSQSPHI